MRRSRHWRVRAESSISAMLSQEPWRGVWWISSRCASANACGGFERLVERADAVGVEVVHDQHDGLGVGVVVGEQVVDLTGPVDLGSVGLGVDAAPAAQGFDPDEDRAGAVADVLAVFFAVLTGLGGDRVADLPEQLVGLLVHAHHRSAGIVGSGVDGQDVFHPGGELGVGVRWDRPALLQMRTQFRFFNTRPMVEWSRSGRSSTSATWRLQQPQRPAGIALGWGRAGQRDQPGLDLAGHDRRHRRRLPRLAADRGQHVARRSRRTASATARTVFVEVPTRCRDHRPIRHRVRRCSSSSSSTRARMIIRAGCTPVVVSLTRNSRSAADKPTVNTFGRGIVRAHPLSSRHELLRTDTPYSDRFSGDTLLVR